MINLQLDAVTDATGRCMWASSTQLQRRVRAEKNVHIHGELKSSAAAVEMFCSHQSPVLLLLSTSLQLLQLQSEIPASAAAAAADHHHQEQPGEHRQWQDVRYRC